MKEWLQVLKAADAAARWHVHQRRKGPAEEPYINHLVEVAMLVAEATEARRIGYVGRGAGPVGQPSPDA
jgi:(p)ppGpp synthase/HD superfamily hydrolase